jgi:hypothetical protein
MRAPELPEPAGRAAQSLTGEIPMKHLPACIAAATLAIAAIAHAHDDESAGQQIKQGAKEVGHGVKKGATAVGHATRDTAKKVGHATKEAATAVGHATRDTARTVGHATKEGAIEVKEGVKDAVSSEPEKK